MTAAVPLLVCLLAADLEQRPVDFDTQIIPLLTRAGCNSGACHGAAVGRGGFQLSLYGSDPASDFLAITQQWEGRRINRYRPERSLFLRKPIADLDHGGDQRFAYDSESADLIRRWIAQGADRSQARTLETLVVTPEAFVAGDVGDEIRLTVSATFDDGHTSDVTRWAVLTAEDPASLHILEDGRVEVLRHGRHLALVRYLDRVVPVHVTLPYQSHMPVAKSGKLHNEIDEHLARQLQTLGLEASPPADDATFLRRITLDLTGRLPDLPLRQEFLSDTSANARERLIDSLLASDEFVSYWTFQLAKLMRVRPIGNDARTAEVFHQWLNDQLATHQPYDETARMLLTATGDSHHIGPAAFHRVVSGPREQAEFVSELFMGVRLRCANCHDHPLDHWTQDDYHGLSAIFARLQRGQVVSIGERGEVTHPRTQEPAVARLPGERFLSDPEGEDLRPQLADWLVSDRNPYFAKAIVNRLWKQMMGRGLVEPVDDLRTTNPGTHPELLDWLADDFAAHGYDLRHTLRRIARSAAYQRSSQSTAQNRHDDRYYSHYLAVPLEPEVLADAVADVTGVPLRYGELPDGTRAVSLIDPGVDAPTLDILGRCGRDESCESIAATGGVAVKLHLLNGAFLNRAISDESGHLSQVLAECDDDRELIETLFVRALTRPPNESELEFWEREIPETPDARRAAAEDFLWSLLTCREFTTNH